MSVILILAKFMWHRDYNEKKNCTWNLAFVFAQQTMQKYLKWKGAINFPVPTLSKNVLIVSTTESFSFFFFKRLVGAMIEFLFIYQYDTKLQTKVLSQHAWRHWLCTFMETVTNTFSMLSYSKLRTRRKKWKKDFLFGVSIWVWP